MGRTDLPETSAPAREERRAFWVLLVCALAVYTANPFGIGLRAVDDCYYARKGVEMARSGSFFTVTWNGGPDFLYPSLQFWLLGRSFALLGENDLAARMPSILEAIGTLVITHRIGVMVLGAPAASSAVALLALAPYFADNARGCMIEMALVFWVSLAFLVILEGLRRPWVHLLLAIPLGAAILTKSILGLIPLPVLAVAALFSPDLRRAFGRPWLWAGMILGLAAGASWSLHQWSRFGSRALRAHYLDNIATLAARPLGPLQRLVRYPVYLLERFQPIILPALAGAGLAWRRARGERDAGAWLLLAWCVVPLLLFNLSGTQERRYLFPLFPPLALLGAWAFERWVPRASWWLRHWVAPMTLILAAAILWVSPPNFISEADAEFKVRRIELKKLIPPGEPLTYLGPERAYWPLANPLMYYAERLLEPASPSTDTALARARARRSQLLLCDRARLTEVEQRIGHLRAPFTGIDWVILEIPPADRPAASGGP